MKKSLAFVCAILCIAGMVIFAGCPQPDTTDPNSYAIGGTVTTADTGIDVTTANIELWQNGQKVAGPIQPGGNGNFSFTGLQAGDAYVVKVSIGDSVSWTSRSISVPNAHHIKAGLTRTKYTVKGTVTSNIPTADLTKVKLYLVQAGDDLAETSPKADGTYSFTNVSAGEQFFVRASLELYDTIFGTVFDIPCQEIIDGIDIALYREAPALNRVKIDGNNLYLIWDQSVDITDANGFSIISAGPSINAITFTGAVAVPNTGNREWRLTMSHAPDASETITLDYDNTVGNVAHVKDHAKPASFNGKAIDPPFSIVSAELDMTVSMPLLAITFNSIIDITSLGSPLTMGNLPSGLSLYFDSSKFSGINARTTSTDSDTVDIYLYNGASNVNKRTVVTLSYSGGIIKAANGDSLTDFTIPVTVVVPPEYKVTGKITSDVPGTDLTKARVFLRQGNTAIASTSPQADGSYQFSNVVAGKYSVMATLNLHFEQIENFEITSADYIVSDIDLERELPLLVEAIVDGTDLRLVWDEGMNITNADGFSINGADPAFGPLTFTGTVSVVPDTDKEEWTLVLSRALAGSEIITLDYDNTVGTVVSVIDGAKPDSFTDEPISKPSTSASFNIVSAEVMLDTMISSLTLTFNADVDIASMPDKGFGNGLDLYHDGNKFSKTSGLVTQTDSDTVTIWFLSLGNGINGNTVFTLSYTGGIIASVDGEPLHKFSNLPVTIIP